MDHHWHGPIAGCLALLACIAPGTGCSHTRKNLIFETTVPLPSGRFVGPVEVDVPRQADHHGRYFEIRTELSATCGPLLHISYPDGEVFRIGDRDKRWQWLLARRAENSAAPAEAAPAPTEAAPAPTETAPAPAETAPAPAEAAPAPAETAPPNTADSASGTVPEPPEPGHWQQVATESWPGQIEFLRARDVRCSTQGHYRRTYVTGYDENGRITVWAEVPQDLAQAKLSIRVYEIVDEEAEREAVARVERKRVKAERRRQKEAARAEARARKPRPPMPAPIEEHPAPALAEGATWSPGHWVYAEGKGKWVWFDGYWLAPAQVPGPKAEDHGPPPVAGCTWQIGHWVWVRGPGSWNWVPGHWNAPPPKVEERGTPPVPESPWVSGRWIAVEGGFEWIAGYWGRPSPRTETIPPPPHQGATWRAGTWLKIKGKWVWSPGFYEQTHRPPPPRKSETPGTKPHPDAVWLAGYWRWRGQRNDYEWIAGHWELPPGEGYVWVPDPPDPQVGVSVGGHWKLRIDVDVPAPRVP